MECVCGLDHSKPLPTEYDCCPVIHVVTSGQDAFGFCHVCCGGWNMSKGEKEWHEKDCPYIKSLELSKIHRHMWE